MSINFDVKNNINFGARIAAIPEAKGIKSTNVKVADLKLKGLTAFIGGDVFESSGKIAKHDLLFLDKKLIAIDEFNPEVFQMQLPVNCVCMTGKTVAPSIIDQHTHVILGDHNSLTEDGIRSSLRQLKAEGTGAIVATLLPDSIANIRNQIKILNKVLSSQNEDEAKLLGIHLEGPFLSPLKPGIHNKNGLILPTIENFLAMEPENVRIVTLAPEMDKDYALSKYLMAHGIIPSAGHTVATAEDIQKSGIKNITHIFNAMAPLHHRTPTVANEALFNPDIAVEMIAENSHIIPQVKDLIMREKPADKIILISDTVSLVGKKKSFVMGGKRIYIDENWIARDKAGTLAGSVRCLHDLAKELIQSTKMTFKDFINYACVNPAKNLGLENKFAVRIGESADITVWNNAAIKPEKVL
ncbi:N-acetylglucosamine-6-phosphate deacetylase [bacterium]|nr:N-acetylglucosamine-6-phosphate deacetylase [bacterium]